MAVRRSQSTPLPASTTFTALGLPAVLTKALAAAGITAPFPIQAATLPDALAGRDLLGRGRTGSGKTYAFALPMLTRLADSPTRRRPGRPRALILAPTRELATQIEASIAPLATALSLRTLVVFGGLSPGPQIAGLRAGVDILVACPGRLADHVETGHARLDAVEITVVDEADHMADLGFLPVVRRLLEQTPRSGQRLLFSATLDGQVDVLVRQFLIDPVIHSVDSALSPVEAMSHHVLHVSHDDRFPVLVDLAAAPGSHAGVHAHQTRGQNTDPPARRGRCTGRGVARQPGPDRADAATWIAFSEGRQRRWSPRISRPGASTSTTSASSSMLTHPSSTRRTCTAPAGPPARARRELWSR